MAQLFLLPCPRKPALMLSESGGENTEQQILKGKEPVTELAVPERKPKQNHLPNYSMP